MQNAVIVPVDFTPVSLNALNYACALCSGTINRVIAIHLLDPSIGGGEIVQAQQHNPAFMKVFRHMQEQILEKTTEDLQNFVQQQQQAGANIQPLVAFGTIYDSFAGIADDEGALLTIMGTHGIVGMQHLTGSRAYKVVACTGKPFLVVQTKPYTADTRWYLVFKDAAQLRACAAQLAAIMGCIPGEVIINVVSGSASLPAALQQHSARISLTSEHLTDEASILHQAEAAGANAVGYCIDRLEESDSLVYGIGQARIMANEAEMPVLCLTES